MRYWAALAAILVPTFVSSVSYDSEYVVYEDIGDVYAHVQWDRDPDSKQVSPSMLHYVDVTDDFSGDVELVFTWRVQHSGFEGTNYPYADDTITYTVGCRYWTGNREGSGSNLNEQDIEIEVGQLTGYAIDHTITYSGVVPVVEGMLLRCEITGLGYEGINNADGHVEWLSFYYGQQLIGPTPTATPTPTGTPRVFTELVIPSNPALSDYATPGPGMIVGEEPPPDVTMVAAVSINESISEFLTQVPDLPNAEAIQAQAVGESWAIGDEISGVIIERYSFGCPFNYVVPEIGAVLICVEYDWLKSVRLGGIEIPTWPFVSFLAFMIVGWFIRR